MSAHTPGPWGVDRHALSIWAPNAKIGGEAKIFDVRGWGYLTGAGHGALNLPHGDAKAIQRANANVAAAAPDLLAALRGFVLNERQLNDEHFAGVQERLMVLARAAIAKASGEESDCPGHIASDADPKVCGRCGTHIDSLRPEGGAA